MLIIIIYQEGKYIFNHNFSITYDILSLFSWNWSLLFCLRLRFLYENMRRVEPCVNAKNSAHTHIQTHRHTHTHTPLKRKTKFVIEAMHFARNIYGISWYAQLWKAFSAAFNIIIVGEECGKSVFLLSLPLLPAFPPFAACLPSLFASTFSLLPPLSPSSASLHSLSVLSASSLFSLLSLAVSLFLLALLRWCFFFTRLGALRVYFMCNHDAWQMKSVKMPSVGAAINHTRRIVALEKRATKSRNNIWGQRCKQKLMYWKYARALRVGNNFKQARLTLYLLKIRTIYHIPYHFIPKYIKQRNKH